MIPTFRKDSSIQRNHKIHIDSLDLGRTECIAIPKSSMYKHSQKRVSCNKPVEILYQRVDIRMRSHGSIVDDKSVASCQQTCCKLTVKTCYPQACCKFQQVVTNLQMTSCNKPDFNTLVVT